MSRREEALAEALQLVLDDWANSNVILEDAMDRAHAALAIPSATTSPAEEYAKRNPLGGPAVVFEAMASRIRAGEDYYSVLDDYGLSVKETKSATTPTSERRALAIETFIATVAGPAFSREDLREEAKHILKGAFPYTADRGMNHGT